MTVTARIVYDDPCTGCGYNLRGLLMDDKCPECGCPATDTVRGDGWETAPEAWVRGLRGGSSLMRHGVRWMPLLVYPGVFLIVVGAFRLTARRPGDDESWMAWNKRLLGRWIVVVGGVSMLSFVLYCLALGFQWLFDMGIGRQRAGDIFEASSHPIAMNLDVWFLGTHLTFVMGFIMLCDYVRALGQRVPDGALVAATARLGWRTAMMLLGLVLLRVGMEIGWTVGGMKGHFSPLGGMAVGAMLTVGSLLGLLVWWWWSLLRWVSTLARRLEARDRPA